MAIEIHIEYAKNLGMYIYCMMAQKRKVIGANVGIR